MILTNCVTSGSCLMCQFLHLKTGIGDGCQMTECTQTPQHRTWHVTVFDMLSALTVTIATTAICLCSASQGPSSSLRKPRVRTIESEQGPDPYTQGKGRVDKKSLENQQVFRKLEASTKRSIRNKTNRTRVAKWMVM